MIDALRTPLEFGTIRHRHLGAAGDARRPTGGGYLMRRLTRPCSAASDLRELVVDPVVNKSSATRMVTNSGEQIIHHGPVSYTHLTLPTTPYV